MCYLNGFIITCFLHQISMYSNPKNYGPTKVKINKNLVQKGKSYKCVYMNVSVWKSEQIYVCVCVCMCMCVCVCLSVCFILPLLYKFVCLLKRIAQQYQKGLARFTLEQEYKYPKKAICNIELTKSIKKVSNLLSSL